MTGLNLRHPRTPTSLLLILLPLFISIASGEQLRPYYKDGNFSFPPQLANDADRKQFPIYDVGSQMTIRWNTTYKTCNLFYAQYDDTANSRQLASGLGSASYVWEPIKVDYTNLSNPFHFRCVDPSNKDQTGSGFWSSGFYLRDRSAGSTTRSVSRTASVSSLTSSVSSGTGSPSSSPSSASPTLSSGAIAGIVIGIVGGFAAVVAATYFFLRQRRKSKMSELDAQQSALMLYPPNNQYPPDAYHTDAAGYHWADPKVAQQPDRYSFPAEVSAANSRVELPASNEARFELPTNNDSPRAHT